MRLIQFTYRGDDWRLALPVNLQEVNLLVGKNAVGKSKTVRALGNVLLYLMQLNEFLYQIYSGVSFFLKTRTVLLAMSFS